jgi:hypothetical protein
LPFLGNGQSRKQMTSCAAGRNQNFHLVTRCRPMATNIPTAARSTTNDEPP